MPSNQENTNICDKITTPSEAKKSSDYQNSSAVVPVMKYTNHCNKTIGVEQMKPLSHFQIILVSWELP